MRNQKSFKPKHFSDWFKKDSSKKNGLNNSLETKPNQNDPFSKDIQVASKKSEEAVGLYLSSNPDIKNAQIKSQKELYSYMIELGLSPLLINSLATKYKINDFNFGQGGMGEILQAKHHFLDREELIKIIHSERNQKPDLKKESFKRFQREARILAMMNHPNIAKVYNFQTDEDANSAWMSMEKVEGNNLREEKSFDGFDQDKALTVLSDIAFALQALDQKEILHRDIKPTNIVIQKNKDGYVAKLIDFGLAINDIDDWEAAQAVLSRVDSKNIEQAKDEMNKITNPEVILGTPAFMSLEQLTGKSITVKSDIFSLGVSMYELLSNGKPPYIKNENYTNKKDFYTDLVNNIKKGNADHLQELNAYLSYKLSNLIMQMISPDPEERPTPNEIIKTVQEIKLSQENDLSYEDEVGSALSAWAW